MKRFVLLGFVLAGFGCQKSDRSSLNSQGTAIVPEYDWCEGAAERPEHGYGYIGLHSSSNKVKIMMFFKKREVPSDTRPYLSLDWESKRDNTPQIDTIFAQESLKKGGPDGLALFAVKTNPDNAEISASLRVGAMSIVLPKLTCQLFGKPFAP